MEMEIYVKYLLFPYFLFCLVFKQDFIRCVDYTRIAASNAASEDVTNYRVAQKSKPLSRIIIKSY